MKRDFSGFNVRRLDSFHRDFLIKLTKKNLKSHLRLLSRSDIIVKPLQFVTAIEEYIRNK